MGQVSRLDREGAARVLGVPSDVEPNEVRRAFRLWAAVLHPDQGGSDADFALLCEARALMLATYSPAIRPESRHTWRQILRWPARVELATALTVGLVAILVALLPAWRGLSATTVAPAMLLGVAASWLATRAVLRSDADMGHRVVVTTVCWIVVVVLQVAASTTAGESLLPVLPVLAVPLVASVSLVLAPGAGLWRPRH